VITVHPSTVTAVAIANADLPAWVYATGAANSYLIGAWFRRDPSSGTSFRSLAFIQNNMGFRISNASITARVNQDAATTGTATITAGVDLNNGEWVFILCSVDKGAGTISICAKSAAMGRKFATAAAAYATGTHTPGKFSIAEDHLGGAGNDGGGNTYNQWQGAIGCVCVKNLQLSTQATMEAIVDAIFDGKKRAQGMLEPPSATGSHGLNDDWFAVNAGSAPVRRCDTTLVAGAASGARMGSDHRGWRHRPTTAGPRTASPMLVRGPRLQCGEAGHRSPGRSPSSPTTRSSPTSSSPALPGITTNGIGSREPRRSGVGSIDNTPRTVR
jgi:hypothetical protein